MADSDQQPSILADQAPKPSLLADITSDNYTLLLAVALIVLSVTLAVLTVVYFSHYGLGSKPVIGQITSVSANQAHAKLADLSHDGPRVILAKGDTVVFSPIERTG